MSDFLSHLPKIALAMALIASAFGIINAMIALRAKKRAHVAIEQDFELHKEFQRLLENGDITEEDIEKARHLIEFASKKLSENDQKIVRIGIRNNTKYGEKNFIEDILFSR